MHHTDIKDRKIRVELTAGGGGNSDARKQKIKAKRDKLNQERLRNFERVLEGKANKTFGDE